VNSAVVVAGFAFLADRIRVFINRALVHAFSPVAVYFTRRAVSRSGTNACEVAVRIACLAFFVFKEFYV